MKFFGENIFSVRNFCVSRDGKVVFGRRYDREIHLYSNCLIYVSPYYGKWKRINGYFDSGNKGIKKALRYVTSALDREYSEHFGSEELNLKVSRKKPQKFRRFRR